MSFVVFEGAEPLYVSTIIVLISLILIVHHAQITIKNLLHECNFSAEEMGYRYCFLDHEKNYPDILKIHASINLIENQENRDRLLVALQN
jgi:hypothetical protein